ncbi:MAG: lipopolysaccharide biosynthesis protein [Planctomycetota bacterium]|nr:MAG: lipopolysaccharide biosynthesis protein [Planctomycetota bacterium]
MNHSAAGGDVVESERDARDVPRGHDTDVASDTHSAQPCSRRNRWLKRLGRILSNPDARNGALSLFDQAIVSGASFLTAVVVGRACSQSDLGVFYLALTIVYIARGVQEHLISAPYVIYCQQCRPERRELFAGSALVHSFGLSIVATLVLVGLLGCLALSGSSSTLASAVWVLLAVLPILQLREFIRRMSIAHLRISTAIAIDVVVATVQIGGLLALALSGRLTVGIAYAVLGAACAVACCGWFLVEWRRFCIVRPVVIRDWWRNWGFARWALASHVLSFTALYITPWLVMTLRGSAEAGVLAACMSIVGVASMFMTGLSTFLIPRASVAFAQGGVTKLRKVLRTAEIVYAAVIGTFAVTVLATGDFLLVLAFGDAYVGYGTTTGVLSMSMFVQSLGLTAGIGLWAIDRPDANLLADAVTLVVTLVLVLSLLPALGVLGAALGDLGGRFVGTLARHATLRACLVEFTVGINPL